MSSLLRALRHSGFALLWTGQTISRVGDRIFDVSLAWWVLEATGSTAAMATVLTLTMAPMLVFLLLGGAIVDRFPRLRLMLVADLVRGLLLGLTAWLALTSRLVIRHVYVISLVSGLVEAFFQPAYHASVPDLVPAPDLPSANSLSSLSGQISGIAGPALGAAIVASGGTALAFSLDSLTFLVSVACLLPLVHRTNHARTTRIPATVFSDVKQGLKTVAASPWLWITIVLAGVSNISYSGPMDVLLPFLIRDHYQAKVATLGWFHSASSVGAVLAALWIGRVARLRRRGLLVYIPWMLIGVLMMVLALPLNLPAILGVGLLMGLCNSVLGLAWTNSVQEMVPPELLGRVTSVDYLGSYLLLPVGYALAGWAASWIQLAAVFVIGGLLQLLPVLAGMLHPQIRRMD